MHTGARKKFIATKALVMRQAPGVFVEAGKILNATKRVMPQRRHLHVRLHMQPSDYAPTD